MKKNKIMICGKKTSTLPTPPIAPSTTRLRSAPSGRAAVTAPPARPTPASISAISGRAQRNTAEKTTSIKSGEYGSAPESVGEQTIERVRPAFSPARAGGGTTPSSIRPAQA